MSKNQIKAPMVSILTYAFWTMITKDEGAVKTVAEYKIHSVWRNNRRKVKLVKFMVGMVGVILFQYFFKLTSWHHIKAFLCITVSWLAILVVLGISDDLGVFDFLLGNVVVGCTASRYALGRDTWFAYAAAITLYGLRLLLESVPLEDKRGSKVITLQMRPNSFLGRLFVRLIMSERSKEEESAQKREIFRIPEVKMEGRESVDVVVNGTQDRESTDVVGNKAQERKSYEIVEHEIKEREGADNIVDNKTRERLSIEIVFDEQTRERQESVEIVGYEVWETDQSDRVVVDIKDYQVVGKLRRCTSCPNANGANLFFR